MLDCAVAGDPSQADALIAPLRALGPIDDTAAMARNVVALWESGAQAAGRRARAHVVENFGWNRTFERLLGTIYPRALAAAAVRTPRGERRVRQGVPVTA